MSAKLKLPSLAVLVLGSISASLHPLSAQSGTDAVQREAATSGLDGRALQDRIRNAARKASPSVVAISHGSGVIVTADGLILSQRHVVTLPFPDAKPGFKVTVVLANGRNATAQVLGIDPLYDLVALRLPGPGPYPFSPLAEGESPQLGEGVLKLGHPAGGPDEGRPPVVRFGRVLVRTEDQFICDCLVNGGDSGGPFIDLRGRVVGLQGPPGIAVQWPTVDQPKEQLAVKDMDRRVNYLDTGRAAPLLRKRLAALARRAIVPTTAADENRKRADDIAMMTAPTLPVSRWCQGTQSLRRHRTEETCECVVELLDISNEVLALGTTVDTQGFVLTTVVPAVAETSYSSGELRCRLSSGRVVGAKVVGIDLAYNLALLRVHADGLKSIEWVNDLDISVGTLLAAIGPGELPLAAGIVSVTRRQVAAARPVPTGYTSAAPLDMNGRFITGMGFLVESAGGTVLDGGIRRGDFVVSIFGAPIHSQEQLSKIAVGRGAGQRVTMQVLREGQTLEMSLILPRCQGMGDWDFYPPVAFEGDLPILQSECGCPVIGLDGKAVGVAVGRIAPQACLIVPADQVIARIADLRIGKPLSSLPKLR